MAGSGAIDITFDFRADTPPGKDPDALSPTLRRYHRLLWSKPLPSGVPFALSDTSPGDYLHHRSELGEFFLASDAVVPSFTREVKLSEIIAQVPQAQHDEFNRIGYTIGGMMIWPGRRVDRKMTINGRRGFHPRIKDRFDLTVECIRRHYRGEPSPLDETLDRYADFFALFGDFRGFTDFFLLQDLVTEDRTAVRCFLPFEGFDASPLPRQRRRLPGLPPARDRVHRGAQPAHRRATAEMLGSDRREEARAEPPDRSAAMSPEEYRGKRDWLRSNPHGLRARMVERELRAWDRELERQGLTVEAWSKVTPSSPWYVAFFHDRPGQPLASACRHADRDCQHLRNIGNEDIRQTTDAEFERLESVRHVRMSAEPGGCSQASASVGSGAARRRSSCACVDLLARSWFDLDRAADHLVGEAQQLAARERQLRAGGQRQQAVHACPEHEHLVGECGALAARVAGDRGGYLGPDGHAARQRLSGTGLLGRRVVQQRVCGGLLEREADVRARHGGGGASRPSARRGSTQAFGQACEMLLGELAEQRVARGEMTVGRHRAAPGTLGDLTHRRRPPAVLGADLVGRPEDGAAGVPG